MSHRGLNKVVAMIWLIAGIALLIQATIALWRIAKNPYTGLHSGAFKAALIVIGFSLLCILGSIGSLLKQNWGQILVYVSAIIILVYAASYVLLGGYDDTGPFYAFIVAGFTILSLATFATAGRRKQDGEWST